MSDGAIDNDFDAAEQSYDEQVDAALEGVRTEVVPGSVAFDIVTRQPVFVRQQVADDLEAYYEENGFDLQTYKMHPFLPGVDADNAAFECVFLPSSVEQTHKPGKTYDYPVGRLVPMPVEMAWNDAEVGSL